MIVRVRAGIMAPAHCAAWPSLATRAPSPLREAIGTAAIFGGRLFVGTSDRGGVSIAPDFSAHAKLLGLPIGISGGVGCVGTDSGASTLEGPAFDCFVSDD